MASRLDAGGALPTTQEIDHAVRVSSDNKKWADDAERLAEAKIKALAPDVGMEELSRLMVPEIVESLAALLIALGDGSLSQVLVLREVRALREDQARQHEELIQALQAVGRRTAGPPPGGVRI